MVLSGAIPQSPSGGQNCREARDTNEEIANNKKILPYHKRADKRLGDIQKSVWQPLQYCKC